MFDYGVYYPFDFAFFVREGGRPLFREVVVEIGPPPPLKRGVIYGRENNTYR